MKETYNQIVIFQSDATKNLQSAESQEELIRRAFIQQNNVRQSAHTINNFDNGLVGVQMLTNKGNAMSSNVLRHNYIQGSQ